MGRIARVTGFSKTFGDAVIAPARSGTDDVEKDAVGVVARADFFDLQHEVVEIARVQAQFMKAGAVVRVCPGNLAVRQATRPLRMFPIRLLVEPCRNVNRHFDVDGMCGFDLSF
jgi:hypothetical protein